MFRFFSLEVIVYGIGDCQYICRINFRNHAKSYFDETINNDKILEIMEKVNEVDQDKKVELRKKLNDTLRKTYIMQYKICLGNFILY